MCTLLLFLEVHVSGCAQEQLFDIHLLYLLQETISSISDCFLIISTHLLSVHLCKYSFAFCILTRLAHMQCHFWPVFLQFFPSTHCLFGTYFSCKHIIQQTWTRQKSLSKQMRTIGLHYQHIRIGLDSTSDDVCFQHILQ